MIARLVLITGLAPSVIEVEDYAMLTRVLELHEAQFKVLEEIKEDADFEKWKRDNGYE